MSFRRYGGLNYAPKNNIMASNYNNINNLSVSQAVGQPNSYINFLSDISGNININGDFDISGNLHVAGNIDCSGNENIYGNLYVAGNIDCSGNSTANYMFLTSGTNYTTSPNGVVPKSYVDTIGSGIRPLPLSNLISNNGPITLSGNQTIDGVQTVNGTVVLVNAQDGSGNPSINNGIYIASSGAWSRADYLTTGDDAAGTITFINNGTTYANTRWFCVSPSPAIIGTNMVLWSQYDAPFKLGRGLQLVTIDNAPTIQVDSSLNFIQYLDNTAGPSPGTINIGTNTTNINIGNTLSTNTINGYTSIDGSSNSTENNSIFQINNNTNNISTVLKINPGLYRNDPSSNYVTYEANDLLNGGACTHYFWDDVMLDRNLTVFANVGIGIFTPPSDYRLDVAGNARIQGASGGSDGPPLLKLVNNTVQYQGGQSNIEFWNNNSGYRLGKISAIDIADASNVYQSALALSVNWHTGDPINGNPTGFVEGMRLVNVSQTQVNVGIGTTTPGSTLDVSGNLIISGPSGINYLQFPNTTKQYTAYAPIYYDGIVASTSPQYIFRFGIFNSSNAPSASAYQYYIYKVGGSQTLNYGQQQQYTNINAPNIIGGQSAMGYATKENISFDYNGGTYNAWGYSMGIVYQSPEPGVSYYSTINTQSGADWTLSFFMKMASTFNPAPNLTMRLMLVPVI
jgi:hypothetical protein